MNDRLDGMSKETFSKLPVDSKLDTLFDCMVSVNNSINKSNKYDKLVATLGGVVGGVLAVVGKGVFWK